MGITSNIAKFFALLFGLGFLSCKPRSAESDVASLAFDTNATNIALMIAVPGQEGSAGYLDGSIPATKRLGAVLEGADFRFRVVYMVNPTVQEIATRTAQLAMEVSANGTLFWYFDGHGAQNGDLAAIDKTFPFSTVATEVRNQRRSPIRRLYVTTDACYGGNLVQGGVALTKDADSFGALSPAQRSDIFVNAASVSFFQDVAKPQNGSLGLDASGLYQEVVVAASTTTTQTAANLSTEGGYFNKGFEQAVNVMKGQRATATIDQLFKTLRDYVSQQTSNQQTPSYRVSSPEVGSNLVFMGSGGPGQPGTATPAPGVLPGAQPNPAGVPSVGDASCPNNLGFPWGPGHGRNAQGACIQPQTLCQCKSLPNKTGCSFLGAGATAFSAWLLEQTPSSDAPGMCYQTCKLMALRSIPVRLWCKQYLVLNPLGQLEVLQTSP